MQKCATDPVFGLRWVWYLARRTWRLIFAPLRLNERVLACVVARVAGSREYKGIRLVAFPPFSQAALDDVIAALELLLRTDSRRFNRVTRHIKKIFLVNRPAAGSYRPEGAICYLRKQLPHRIHPLAKYGYASVLVHEATHGLLENRGFPYTWVNRARIEGLCGKEEERFLKKFSLAKEKVCRFGKWRGYFARQRDNDAEI